LPICPETLKGVKPSSINYDLNPDLKGLNSLQILDKVILELAKNGFYIVLDHHNPDCQNISETPEINGYTLEDWINDLKLLADRYKFVPNVIGIDIKNEPHGRARW
jgi:endoglucanase